MAFFDIRILDPNSKRYSAQGLQRCYINKRKEKKRQDNREFYKQKNGIFIPLAFSINGGMGREVSKCYSRIAEMLSEKRDEPYSITISQIRRKLTFSLISSIITCIRDSRTLKSNEEKQCRSEVASYGERRCVNQE